MERAMVNKLEEREGIKEAKAAKINSTFDEANYQSIYSIPWAPPLGKGIVILATMRCNAYWNFEKLAAQRIVGPRFKTYCPFCRSRKAESITHLVAECETWAATRTKWLGREFQECHQALRHGFPNKNGVELSKDIATIILGGSVGGIQLENWGSGIVDSLRVIGEMVEPRHSYLQVGAWETDLEILGSGQKVVAFLYDINIEREKIRKEFRPEDTGDNFLSQGNDVVRQTYDPDIPIVE